MRGAPLSGHGEWAGGVQTHSPRSPPSRSGRCSPAWASPSLQLALRESTSISLGAVSRAGLTLSEQRMAPLTRLGVHAGVSPWAMLESLAYSRKQRRTSELTWPEKPWAPPVCALQAWNYALLLGGQVELPPPGISGELILAPTPVTQVPPV